MKNIINCLVVKVSVFIACVFVLGTEMASAAAKPKAYPLDVCLVTGNDLESMDGSITKVYGEREIKFCCKPCIKKFEANQAKYLAKLK